MSLKPDFFFAGGSYNIDGSRGLATEEDLRMNGAQVFYMECAAHGTSDSVGNADPRSTIEIVYSRIEDLGKIFGVPDRAASLVAQMKSDIAAVQQRIQGRPPVRVFVTYGTEDSGPVPGTSDRRFDFALAGGKNLLSADGPTGADVSREVVAAFDPEVIITTCYATGPIEVEARENEQFLRRIFSNVAAVKNDRVVAMESINLPPGVRNARAVRLVAEALFPEAFQ